MARRLAFLKLLLRAIWKFALAWVAVYFGAALGFWYLHGANEPGLLNSFYWAIATLSTVGYGDVVPVTVDAKLFAIAIIGIEIFLGAYLVSVVLSVVGEESRQAALGTLGTDLAGHIVVLGYTPVGQSAVRELLAQGEKVALLTDKADEVANLRTLAPESRFFVTYAASPDEEILNRMNIDAATAAIICTSDDTLNLIAAINLRSRRPRLRVVVSVARPELRQTLKAAGVTYVTSPGQMSGRLCANAAFRPDIPNVIEGFSATSHGADITEYVLRDDSPLVGKSLGEAERLVRGASDGRVIGYARARPDGEHDVRLLPPVTEVLRAGDALIVMGTLDSLQRTTQYLGVAPGR